MKLESLKARNIKGTNFDMTFAPITIITGDNFIGKTTVIDGLSLALLGFHTNIRTADGKVSKTNDSIFAISSGSVMSVELITDQPFPGQPSTTVARSWEKKGSKITLTGHAEPVTDLAILEPSTFLGLSDRERTRYVFSRAKIDGLTAQAIVDKIMATPPLEIADDMVIANEVLNGVSAEVHSEFKNSESPQAAVSTLLTTFKEAQTEESAEVKRFEKTIQGLVELRSENESLSAGITEESVTKEESEISADIETKSRQLGGLQEQSTKARRNLALRNEIEAEIADIEGNAPPDELLDSATPEAVATLREDLAKLEGRVSAGRSKVGELNADMRRAESDLRAATGDYEQAKANHDDTCPTCQQGLSNEWHDKVVSLFEEKKTACAAKARDLSAKAEKWKSELDKLEASLTKTKNTIASLEDLLRKKTQLDRVPGLKKQLEALTIADDTETNKTINELNGALEALRERQSLVRQKRQALANTKSFAKNMAESEDKAKRARAKLAAFKAGTKVLEQTQSDSMVAAFKPILEIAAMFTNGIFNSAIEFHDGELGRWRDGIWIPVALFSGAEKAIAYAALQCALASESQCRVAIVDELGRLRSENKTKLIGNVRAAIEAGKIDHAIFIDVDDAFAEKAQKGAKGVIKHTKLVSK